MVWLPLLRTHLAALSKTLTRNVGTPTFLSLCNQHHALCALTVQSDQKKRISVELTRQHRCCRPYHTGLQSKFLENVKQLDLETEDSKVVVPDEMETCDASEVLLSLNPEETKKLKMIKLEFDVHAEMTGRVPENMADENWLHAFRLDSKSKRLNYYRFLCKRENIRKSKERKKAVRQENRVTVTKEKDQTFDKNTIFMLVRDSTMIKVANSRLARAMMFGQPLIFDLDYEQYMRPQDCQNVVDQLIDCYARNRSHLNPFHMMFTSLDPSGRIFPKLKRQMLAGQHFLGTMTDWSYLDLFPHDRLVYLTPHAREELKRVNHSDVYIVGGFVDKACSQPISLARAKEQGIRTAKFPLDSYLFWGDGSKSLTLDQVLSILLEQRESNDWQKAFKVIPRRKLKQDDAAFR